jgi:hypothetical protein
MTETLTVILGSPPRYADGILHLVDAEGVDWHYACPHSEGDHLTELLTHASCVELEANTSRLVFSIVVCNSGDRPWTESELTAP